VLRLVDTALVGLIAIMATGERRARLGDLAAGTMVVSTNGARSAPAAEVAPAAIDVAPVAEDVTPLAEDELDAAGEELAELEDHEPTRGYEPITGVAATEAEPEPVAEEAEPVVEAWPPADSPLPADHTLDVATPSLKELAQDVAAAAGSEQESGPAVEVAPKPAVEVAPEPVVEVAPGRVVPEPVVEVAPEPVVEVDPEPIVELAQPRPLAEVEIGGPEIDVDEPQVTVRSVDTVSAIDLIMGAGEPSEDRRAADEPPAGA
jgi:hypothetical protein